MFGAAALTMVKRHQYTLPLDVKIVRPHDLYEFFFSSQVNFYTNPDSTATGAEAPRSAMKGPVKKLTVILILRGPFDSWYYIR